MTLITPQKSILGAQKGVLGAKGGQNSHFC